jgi:prolyl oligopeptidase
MRRKSLVLSIASLATLSIALAAVPLTPLSQDPYVWLSDVHGQKAIAWVKEQDSKSDQVLKADPAYRTDYDAILGSLNSQDRLPLGQIRHGVVYNFWQDAQHPRGIWRRAPVAELAKDKPGWELLIDVDKLDTDEHMPFVWQGYVCAPDEEHCLVRLSPGGSDATTVREFDLKTKSFVPDGFSLSLSKLDVAWLDADTILFGTDFGPGTMTRSSYPRIVKLWHRGQPIAGAKTLFEARETDISARPFVYDGPYGTIPLIVRGITFFTNDVFYLKPDGSTLRLPLPLDADIQGVTGGYLIFSLRDPWMPVGGKRLYAPGSLLAFAVAPFVEQHRAHFSLLAAPGAKSMIDSVAAGRDAVYAAVFTNVTGQIHEFRPGDDGKWTDAALSLPSGGSTEVSAADAWGPDAEFTFGSFLDPPTLYAFSEGGAPKAVRSQKALFDPSGYAVTQSWVKSKDGTVVPYFLIDAKNAKGAQPTILYAYGGFQLSNVPWYFNDGHKPLYPAVPWLGKGGAIAVANIRGGGEFGPKWHEAAMKFNRQHAFDDFEAVAADLERRGVATSRTLGIVGASNGGLLVTASMTERPDLFHAVVCQRPLIDMLHYTGFGAGASWVDEYGDPADPRMRDYIARYSPYQNVKTGMSYPDVLFITETSDDRVTPVWARMMAAKMEAQGHSVMFDESLEGGHGPGATNAAQAEMWALSYTFFGRELGLASVQN